MPRRYNRNRMYGRGYNQYDPIYQAAGFNPAVFEGTDVDFKPYDYSIYERGLANLQARMDKAVEQQGAVDMALSNIELQLNPAEREWFSGYKQDIKNQIQSDIDAGNFGSAIRKATKLGSQAASDSRIVGRIEANTKYQEEIKKQKDRVAKGEVSQDAFNWWLKNNEYIYEDAKDANGNIVSGTEQVFTPLYDKLNIPALAMSAFKLITADKGSTSRDGSSSVSNQKSTAKPYNNKSYQPGESISSSHHESSSFEKVSADDIIANMKEIIALTPGGIEQVEQEFNVALDKFKDLENKYKEALKSDPESTNTENLGQQLEQRKKLLFRNGSKLSYDEYFARIIADNLFAQNLAYDWRNSATGGSSSYSISDTTSHNNSGRNSGSNLYNGDIFGGNYFTGPKVERGSNFDYIEGETYDAVRGVNTLFKNE